jgi:hypothetical protein
VGRGITPTGRQREREAFARAVESRSGGDSTGSATPDALADDLAVVALLRRAAPLSGPTGEERDRIRQRVLDTPAGDATRSPARSSARGRLLVALAAALCLVFSLAGMSLLLSRGALPGDALYPVKRNAESAALGLTFGEEERALKHLEFATARLAEMETMADRFRESGGGPAGGYLTALTDFDADAAEGARLLATFGVNSGGEALTRLADWAGSHGQRLAALRPGTPPPVAERAGASLDLLDRVRLRAEELIARAACLPVTSGSVDEVGPVPAEGCGQVPVAPDSTTGPPTPTAPPASAAPPTERPGGSSQPAPAATTAPPVTSGGSPAPVPSAPGTPVPAPPTTTSPPVLTLPLPLPLPLPGVEIPALVPGLPAVGVGG